MYLEIGNFSHIPFYFLFESFNVYMSRDAYCNLHFDVCAFPTIITHGCSPLQCDFDMPFAIRIEHVKECITNTFLIEEIDNFFVP